MQTIIISLMYKTLFLISIVCLLVGCDEKMYESIDFVKPQPVGEKNQDSFNKKYKGVW